ncbi:N/A [soil metagenome]
MTSVAMALGDGAGGAERNLFKIRRIPKLLIWTLMSPIMFVLLFGYVFGSSIPISGASYREYLIAGIFVQTVIFGSTFTGAGLAEDMTKGIIDRFRSLPMAQSAGARRPHCKRHLLQLGLDSGHVDHRPDSRLAHQNLGNGSDRRFPPVAAVCLCILLDHGLCWAESVQRRGRQQRLVHVHLPIDVRCQYLCADRPFARPPETFAEWNPVSAVAQAAREAFGNTGTAPPSEVWALAHPVVYSLIWVGIILAIFVPLSVGQYNKSATR